MQKVYIKFSSVCFWSRLFYELNTRVLITVVEHLSTGIARNGFNFKTLDVSFTETDNSVRTLVLTIFIEYLRGWPQTTGISNASASPVRAMALAVIQDAFTVRSLKGAKPVTRIPGIYMSSCINPLKAPL